jgi:glycosyltransferase involved in cell wall biosynthesis
MQIPLRKILHLRTVSGHGGGPEKTLLASPTFLADQYNVRLLYIRPVVDPNYDMPQRARNLGVELVDIPERGPLDPRTWWRAARAVRQFQPDLLHAHDYKTNILSLCLGWKFRLPVVTTLHGYVTRGTRLDLYYRLDRHVLRRIDHCIAVSQDLDNLLADLGVAQQRRSLIENGIDTELFQRRVPQAEMKQQLGFQPDRLLVGAVGRLQPEKGFGDLIQAAAGLLDRDLDFDLAIIGDGPLHKELEQQIALTGHRDRIRLLGFRGDMIELYQALDVFALSSYREGLPNVLLEAMAMGTAVVATRIAGIPQVIQSGVNGLLVEPGDCGPLQTALRDLLRSPSLRQQLQGRARQTVEQRYSFAMRMERVRNVYDRIISSRHSSN